MRNSSECKIWASVFDFSKTEFSEQYSQKTLHWLSQNESGSFSEAFNMAQKVGIVIPEFPVPIEMAMNVSKSQNSSFSKAYAEILTNDKTYSIYYKNEYARLNKDAIEGYRICILNQHRGLCLLLERESSGRAHLVWESRLISADHDLTKIIIKKIQYANLQDRDVKALLGKPLMLDGEALLNIIDPTQECAILIEGSNSAYTAVADFPAVLPPLPQPAGSVILPATTISLQLAMISGVNDTFNPDVKVGVRGKAELEFQQTCINLKVRGDLAETGPGADGTHCGAETVYKLADISPDLKVDLINFKVHEDQINHAEPLPQYIYDLDTLKNTDGPNNVRLSNISQNGLVSYWAYDTTGFNFTVKTRELKVPLTSAKEAKKHKLPQSPELKTLIFNKR